MTKWVFMGMCETILIRFDEKLANALNSIHKECLYLQSMSVLNIEQVGDDNPDFLYILLEHFSVR